MGQVAEIYNIDMARYCGCDEYFFVARTTFAPPIISEPFTIFSNKRSEAGYKSVGIISARLNEFKDVVKILGHYRLSRQLTEIIKNLEKSR